MIVAIAFLVPGLMDIVSRSHRSTDVSGWGLANSLGTLAPGGSILTMSPAGRLVGIGWLVGISVHCKGFDFLGFRSRFHPPVT